MRMDIGLPGMARKKAEETEYADLERWFSKEIQRLVHTGSLEL
jgi:hypothetical protein